MEYTFFFFGLYSVGLSSATSPYNGPQTGLALSISEESVSLETAIQSGYELINEDVLIKHGGWGSIIPYIPKGERFWIAARATHTPFVSWEGCAEWIGDQIGDQECDNSLYPGGSIGDCIRHCGTEDQFVLLEGKDCRCVSAHKRDLCFRQSTDRCDVACPNNPNDWCGGQTMALYYTGPFGVNITTSNGTADNDMNCATYWHKELAENSSEIYFQMYSCNYKLRRYLCGGRNYSISSDNRVAVSWLEALSLCINSKHHLYYKGSAGFKRNSPHWTSVRRGLFLTWTNVSDESFPFCVSVGRDHASRLILYDEVCERRLRYLIIQSGDKDKASWLSVHYIWIVVAVLVVVLATIAGLLYMGITTLRLKHNSFNNDRDEHLAPPPSSVRHTPSSSPVISENRGFMLNRMQEEEIENLDRTRGILEESNNEVSTNVYHTFATAAAIIDAKNQYVYSTVVKKENRKRNVEVDLENLDRTRGILEDSGNAVPTNVYNTFATAAAVEDAEKQYAYSTVIKKEKRKKSDYTDATIGRALSENDSGITDQIYNVDGAWMTPVVDKKSVKANYENALL